VVLADGNLSVEIRELLPGFQATVTASVHPLLMNSCAYSVQSMVLDGKRCSVERRQKEDTPFMRTVWNFAQ